jgi:hypothetical protein
MDSGMESAAELCA